MTTLQHSMMTLVLLDGNEKRFRMIIPYVLLPDAIRRYTGKRELSHFEETYGSQDVSWLEYPLNLRDLSKNTYMNKFLSPEVKSCCIGEMTRIDIFKIHNNHLPKIYSLGVEMHLAQDIIHDIFIREHLNCSNKLEDKFEFNGNVINGAHARNIVADLEEDGMCILAHYIYNKYGIKVNQK